MNHEPRAIAVCESFHARLASLDEAMSNTIDDKEGDAELAATGVVPQHFSSNDDHRSTFTAVVG